MARATKAQSEQTGRRILTEASALFAEHGYASVSLEDVAAAASVTRGAVYHHFGSKRGLFEAVAASAQQQVATAVIEAADGAPDPWAALVAGCRAFLAASLRDDVRRVLLIDAPATLGWSTWREQDAAASGRLLTEAIDGLATSGAITVRSVAGTSALLSGAMNEAALHIAEADDAELALADATVDLERLLEGLRRPSLNPPHVSPPDPPNAGLSG